MTIDLRDYVKAAEEIVERHEIATGAYRAPDPWYAVSDDVVVRRLSPNN